MGAVIYIQAINADCISSSTKQDIEVLKRICGEEVISEGMVTIATTKWHQFPNEEWVCASKEAEMMKRPDGLWWPGLMEKKCAVERVEDQQAARALMQKVLSRMCNAENLPLLQVQRELQAGLSFQNTEAWRWLHGDSSSRNHASSDGAEATDIVIA